MFKFLFANQLPRKFWKCPQARGRLKQDFEELISSRVPAIGSCLSGPSRPHREWQANQANPWQLRGTWLGGAPRVPRHPCLGQLSLASLSRKARWGASAGRAQAAAGPQLSHQRPGGSFHSPGHKTWAHMPQRPAMFQARC